MSVADLGVMHGDFPKRALRHVLDWMDLHQDELLADWDAIQSGRPAQKIEPTELISHQNTYMKIWFCGSGPKVLKVRQDRAGLRGRPRLERLHADLPGRMGDDKEGIEQGADPLIRRHDPSELGIVRRDAINALPPAPRKLMVGLQLHTGHPHRRADVAI